MVRFLTYLQLRRFHGLTGQRTLRTAAVGVKRDRRDIGRDRRGESLEFRHARKDMRVSVKTIHGIVVPPFGNVPLSRIDVIVALILACAVASIA